ncbi:MAG: extracellular solute-binding protein [Clostridia bacterium]|nr:extracellular solute-binding protein [Clostridia bacterium]
MKKINFKRIACLLLALMFLFTTAGCGKTEDNDSKPVSNTQSEKEEVRDLGGRTIKFLANWTEPQKGNSDRENIYWQKKTEVQEKYNCTYEHIYLADDTVYNSFITSILSGDPMADIVSYKYNPFPAIQQDLFYNLSNLKELDFSEDKWLKAVSNMGTVDGKQYLMLSIKFVADNLIFYNKDTFEKYGQEDLWTLQKDGKLTLDKLIEIATNISKASGTYSMRGDDATYAHRMFASASGVLPIEKVDNKLEFKVNVNSTEFVNAYTKAQQLVTDGVLSNGLDATNWSYSRSLFNAGSVPILLGSEAIVDHFAESDFEVGMCVMPTVDGKMTTVGEDLAWCAMPYNVKNPGDVAFIWNIMTDVTFDVDYKIRFRDAVSDDAMDVIEALSKIQTTTVTPVNCDVAASVGETSTLNSMVSGSITPAQAMQTIEPLYEAALKAYLN